jgi:hypothetical protein
VSSLLPRRADCVAKWDVSIVFRDHKTALLLPVINGQIFDFLDNIVRALLRPDAGQYRCGDIVYPKARDLNKVSR